MTCFDGPQGHWNLQRYPVRNNDPLRAWDAADEYLLEELAAHSLPSHPDAKVVVVNDSFAALCCCLHPFHPNLVRDSFLTPSDGPNGNSGGGHGEAHDSGRN